MSLLALPSLIYNRLRDATGFYPCSLPAVRSICSGTDWSRRLQSATRFALLFNENLHDPHATEPSTTLARFAAMVAGSVSDYFKHKLILLQRLSRLARSDSRAPRRDRDDLADEEIP